MSSMRNAAPRRPHRERSQPGARAKWGLLEKHKDYSLRAADYNQKKKKLNVLSQKSREKNPDEFAFGMLASDSQKAGKHGRGDANKNRLSVDEVKLLKGQDAGYLRTILGRTRREVEKVKEEISLDDVLKRRGTNGGENEKKLQFDHDGQPILKKRKLNIDIDSETEDENETENENEVEDIETHTPSQSAIPLITSPEQPSQPPPKTKKQLQSDLTRLSLLKIQRRNRKRIREARTTKLDVLRQRQKSIMAAASELELQRAKMARTVGGVNKDGVRFKVRERKK